MAKYAEVREKQKNVDKVREKEEKFGRGVWVGFTFKAKRKGEAMIDLQQEQDGRDDDAEGEEEDELVTLF
jgi:cell cycle protein kinase DBF2